MSSISDFENQTIIRFPIHIARQIAQKMEQGDTQMEVNIQPFLENQQILYHETPDQDKQIKQVKALKFQVGIPSMQFNKTGTLVDLPTITESYKTRDRTNLFKSNDINQIIWVEDQLPSGVRKVYDKETQSIKHVCDHGLTPPTYDIKKDCYRKQPFIQQEEIQRVEKELADIQTQFIPNLPNQHDEEQSIDQESLAERKSKKKYTKF